MNLELLNFVGGMGFVEGIILGGIVATISFVLWRFFSSRKKIKVLPGNPYAQCAIPLEYPPSRALQPRWGYSKPLIPSLVQWFEKYEQDFRSVMTEMQGLKNYFDRIALDNDPNKPSEPSWRGGPFAAIDLAVLSAFIHTRKPALYLEIGSGMSTKFAKRAAADAGIPMTIVSIDPEPRSEIDAICHEIIREGLETVNTEIFDRLQPGDILYLDGSHRAFMNSDVTVFFIDILPKLKPGVIVHIHDVTLPWDYPDMFVNWYWSEQYLLAAYLIAGMAHLTPLMPTAWVCRREEFQSLLHTPFVSSSLENGHITGGGSLWFTHNKRD